MGAGYRRTNRGATLAAENEASRIIAAMTITAEMPHEVTAAKIALAPASLGNSSAGPGRGKVAAAPGRASLGGDLTNP